MNRTSLLMCLSLAVFGGLLMLLLSSDSPSPTEGEGAPIMLYCAASNKAVMEAVLEDYRAETGLSPEVQYGPSQTLLASMDVTRSGDLYLPADDSYMKLAQDKGLMAEVIPLAAQHGVVAVRKGNPKSITSFADLLREDVRLLQANPEATAIGDISRRILKRQGLWNRLDEATTAYRTTVTEVANGILVGAADAGIVYDAVLHTYPDLDFVELPELKEASSAIVIGVTAGTQQPARALHFARYLAAQDRGLQRYAEYGFRVHQGDDWADVPELSVFAGSMLRPAIDDTIDEFEKREGVRVVRVYNGCGILVTQMQTGQHPDAYFACDTEFMQKVPDLFPEPVDVSQNELVILVPKGNPRNVRTLKDLAMEGLRVGIGHEKQCAMGWLTQNTLREGGVQQEVMANVEVQSPTGDLLVNQLLARSLDAAVVYLSNAAGAAEELDAVPIQGLPCSVATQPFAIAQKSRYRQLAGRLFERICSSESQKDFEIEGFRWRADDAAVAADGK